MTKKKTLDILEPYKKWAQLGLVFQNQFKINADQAAKIIEKHIFGNNWTKNMWNDPIIVNLWTQVIGRYADGGYCTGKFNNGKCLGKTVKLDRTKRNKIAEAKIACEDLGFTPGTEKFAECALKLSTEGSERTSSNRSSDGGGGVNWGGVVDTVERQRQEIERLNRERSNNGNTRVCSYVGNSIVCKDRGY